MNDLLKLILFAENNNTKQETVTDNLFKLYWEQDKDISQIDTLKQALAASGFAENEITSLIEKSNSPDIKKLLKDTTEEAISRGAFGAPTMFVQTPKGEEMIFGSDRFYILFPLIGVPWTGPDPAAKGSSKL